MFLHAFLVTLASVSATPRPRDDAPVPGPIALPPNHANFTARYSFVDPSSLEARQLYCPVGYHACSDGGCCTNSEYCDIVQGILGCCPNGEFCNLPPQGPPTCIDVGYYLCPSQEYCCPYGSDCVRDLYNNPECLSTLPPPPFPTTSTSKYFPTTTSTSKYFPTSSSTPTMNTNPPYTSFPDPPSTTANSFSIKSVPSTTTSESGNGPSIRGSAGKTTLGYTVTGITFLFVAAGLVWPQM